MPDSGQVSDGGHVPDTGEEPGGIEDGLAARIEDSLREDPLAMVQFSWVAGRSVQEPVPGAETGPTRHVVGTWTPTGLDERGAMPRRASLHRGSGTSTAGGARRARPGGRSVSARAAAATTRTTSAGIPQLVSRIPRAVPRRTARAVVVGALAALTIAAPLSGMVSPGNGTYVADPAAALASAAHLYPSTMDALNREPAPLGDPLLAVPATGSRALLLSSRAETREALPGCDPDVRPGGSNGQLRTADLCALWDGTLLRGDAAVALAALNDNFRAQFSRDLCLVSGYRTLASQRVLKATKPGLAATPGRSNHGWGLAIDLCSRETSGSSWAWFRENAPVYGWINPDWALPGGPGPTEPWHWEFIG